MHISVRNGHENLLMCVCGIFFPTHHEMWLGYYPSEFLSFVLLWVARDLFQYLRKHREKSLIYASVALLYAQIPPSNATWPLQRRQRRPTTLTVPLQHHLLMRDQLWTPLSKSRIWSSFAPPPALRKPLGLMSAPVMLRLTGECGIVEVRPLHRGVSMYFSISNSSV